MLKVSGIATSDGNATFIPDADTSFIEHGTSAPFGKRMIEIQFTLVRSEARLMMSDIVKAL
ncbi:hypothetical protein ASF36_23900 [Methylobacterium sp. Leaf90]|nr:hypothetical protein ASF36_23900 [Methylobacterium sp. Leaf90]